MQLIQIKITCSLSDSIGILSQLQFGCHRKARTGSSKRSQIDPKTKIPYTVYNNCCGLETEVLHERANAWGAPWG